MQRHILITGGTGFIGQPLTRALVERGDRVTVLSRQTRGRVRKLCGDVNAAREMDELSTLAHIDAVINLAGAGIAEKRWTQSRKKQLYDSRVALTENLIAALSRSSHRPDVLVSGSAVGFYGNQGDNIVTDDTPPNPGFTQELCAAWEHAAEEVLKLGTRVALSRTGLVVGKGGGFLARMLPVFRMGAGGKLGSGDQFMPWIHRNDMVRGLIFLLDNPKASGAYNLVAPNPVRNEEFTRVLGRMLSRPTVLPVPAVVLKTILGEMALLLLTSQRAVPLRLEAEGFAFEYPELESALAEALPDSRIRQ